MHETATRVVQLFIFESNGFEFRHKSWKLSFFPTHQLPPSEFSLRLRSQHETLYKLLILRCVDRKTKKHRLFPLMRFLPERNSIRLTTVIDFLGHTGQSPAFVCRFPFRLFKFK